MVRAYQVEEELNKIIRKTKAPIIISDLGRYPFYYDTLTGNIFATPTKFAKILNKRGWEEVEKNWKEFLGWCMKHELIHKKQWEFLLQQDAFRKEELYYHWLIEIQALNSLPMLRVAEQAHTREFFYILKIGRVVGIPPILLPSFAFAVPKEELEKAPEPYKEVLLGLKEFALKIRTYEDIIKFAPQAKKLEDIMIWKR